jgi:hypothetical protein
MSDVWFEVVMDADAQDQDRPSLPAWSTYRRGQRIPAGIVQVPGTGASPLAILMANNMADAWPGPGSRR